MGTTCSQVYPPSAEDGQLPRSVAKGITATGGEGNSQLHSVEACLQFPVRHIHHLLKIGSYRGWAINGITVASVVKDVTAVGQLAIMLCQSQSPVSCWAYPRSAEDGQLLRSGSQQHHSCRWWGQVAITIQLCSATLLSLQFPTGHILLPASSHICCIVIIFYICCHIHPVFIIPSE